MKEWDYNDKWKNETVIMNEKIKLYNDGWKNETI